MTAEIPGEAWNSLLAHLPNPHFLQTYEWGQVKQKYGWAPLFAVWDQAGGWRLDPGPRAVAESAASLQAAVLILKRTIHLRGLSVPWSIFYLPKGPNLNWGDASLRSRVLADLEAFAVRQRAIFLKIDPDVVTGTGIPASAGDHPDIGGRMIQAELSQRGWLFSADQIQFRNTVLVDLSLSEEELLARMKQKTRYNIRLAVKKGVVVRAGTDADFPILYRMYAETSIRDGFVIRDEAYYQTVWKTFLRSAAPSCLPLIAEVGSEPVAAIFVFYFAGRAYYVYGMSSASHREKMPNHLLQWEAMRHAKELGCAVYDMWGAPDELAEGDGMWGVFRFKEGLGGEVVRTIGAWDYVPDRFIYRLYTDIMPRVLDFMRARGKARTRQNLLE